MVADPGCPVSGAREVGESELVDRIRTQLAQAAAAVIGLGESIHYIHGLLRQAITPVFDETYQTAIE
jgi:hypothetical protein